ncbi:MAG: hypothetical protein OEU32_05000 [Acidimicrobiia bacterium]|nr:hypothetical protein [Acidimicrobiia bacterium]
MSEYPTRAEWSELVDEQFAVVDTELTLVLHTVTGSDTNYSLEFEGPAAPMLQQGISRLRHGTDEAIDVFLVPVAATDEATRYEAVFNLLPTDHDAA